MECARYVLFEQERTDESDNRGFVWEDADPRNTWRRRLMNAPG